MVWIPITLFAALAQTFRFMFQKRLRTQTLSTGGATFSRFLFAAPVVALLGLCYPLVRGYAWPQLDAVFFLYAAVGGFCQVSATMCVVALFQQRNFTVGITFKKIWFIGQFHGVISPATPIGSLMIFSDGKPSMLSSNSNASSESMNF